MISLSIAVSPPGSGYVKTSRSWKVRERHEDAGFPYTAFLPFNDTCLDADRNCETCPMVPVCEH